MSGPTSQLGKWWFTIDEFLERADRVLSSEVARSEDFATVGTTFNLIASIIDGDVRHRIEYELPREADIESAAARVRPLYLQQDPVFHGKVTNALKGLAQHHASDAEKVQVQKLKEAWQKQEESYRWSMGASKAPGDRAGQMRTDRQIARDFLYGDLVHADPEARARIRYIPQNERLLAAVVWVADATKLTQATKQLYIDLGNTGSLTPRP
ncbi:hypothetical protein [Geodermatophilus sp. SYSU D00700]